jgi:dienelactone hydrolase
MRSLAAPFAALALLAASPAVAADAPPTFDCPPTSQKLAPPGPVTRNADGTTEYSLDIRTPGGILPALVLKPPASAGSTKHPAVLWVHWLGETSTTNHTEFLGDAHALAKTGVISVLVDMPWSKKEWFTALRTPNDDYAATVAQVVSLRQALDLFESAPDVDAKRIAYVGHDFGAMDGALLLAVDNRPAYAVLMAPTLSFWEWYLLGKQPDDRAAYVARMNAFDLPAWLAKGNQKATLLQFGKKDEYVSQATGIAFRNAVPDRDRTFKAYNLDHALEDVTVHTDRVAWLIAHLGT